MGDTKFRLCLQSSRQRRCRKTPANLKTSQFWSSHQRSHASTESHVDHPSGLILQPLLKFAIPTKICYHSSTSNSKQANHFKPNFCLNHTYAEVMAIQMQPKTHTFPLPATSEADEFLSSRDSKVCLFVVFLLFLVFFYLRGIKLTKVKGNSFFYTFFNTAVLVAVNFSSYPKQQPGQYLIPSFFT